MTLIDTSVLIDVLRGTAGAASAVSVAREAGPLHASEITRVEVMAGMRKGEERVTRALLGALVWHPLDERVAELAGQLGREWGRAHRGIDAADLTIAATALMLGATLLTRNVNHYPMFDGLAAPY